ncbi:unnamed protein product [Ilex paraguariensis]|uniref:Protein kinase domain-containing protein n=1 Tax=Ilex paraguariensis TaxID=185542 RepID=A0ABC8UTI6_9AQUA
MTEPVTVSLLWFGTGIRDSGQEAIRNAINSLSPSGYQNHDSEVPTLGSWWEIIRQYRDSSGSRVTDRVDVGPECFYTGLHTDMTLEKVTEVGRSVFNETYMDKFGGNLTCNRIFDVNDNNIYHVVISQNVKFLERDTEQTDMEYMCNGDFPVAVSAGVSVKMAWSRAPQALVDDQCSTFFNGSRYLGPPNGDVRIDSLVGYMLGKIADDVTNRDGKGWISNDGNERTVSCSCGSIFERDIAGPPLFMDTERNVSFNVVGLNGYRYMVHYIWDQSIRNCALKLSETCGSNTVMLKQAKGSLKGGIIANQTTGLQPYPPNQKCQWKIQYPTAKFISFTVNYLSIAPDHSNDLLMICDSDSRSAKCTVFNSNDKKLDRNFKLKGSQAYVQFLSGSEVSFDSRGWELSYSAGLCNGKKDVYAHEGVIGYISTTSNSYTEGLRCQWILHGEPGTPVTLSFTQINISRDLDFLAIYNGLSQQIANFSGLFLGSDLPRMNLTGEIRIAFATQTDAGEGWSAKFSIKSPVDRNRETLIIIIVISIAVVLISGSVALIALAFVGRRRRKHPKMIEKNEKSMLIRAEVKGEEKRIAEGPSSIVYKAVSTNGVSVAIKSPKTSTSQTRLEEEILIKTSSHPNIISLVGYADDGLRRRNLVFEYMSRGSLSWNLEERAETLHWERRLEIAIQISSAIQMLHMYLKPPIYHGNITSENILLDEYYNAKLAGFGAANRCTSNESKPRPPPEMAEDIRSFGLLLVELLRGKPLISGYDSDWIENFEIFEGINSKNFDDHECLDPRLGIPKEECKSQGLAKLGEIAKWCINTNPRIGGYENTPKIGDVVSGLKQVKKLFCSFSS